MSATELVRTSPSPAPPRSPTPGPSGTQNLPELSEEEMAAETEAARAHFFYLIAQNDRQQPACQASGTSGHVQRGRSQGNRAAKAAKFFEDFCGAVPEAKKESNLAGANATRKRADSTDVDGSSPPKRLRGDKQGGEESHIFRFGPVEVLQAPASGASQNSQRAPGTSDVFDYETKLKMIQNLGIASNADCATTLYECAGNVERAVQGLGGKKSATPFTGSIRIQSPPISPRGQARSSIRIRSPECISASQPESGPDAKIAQLKEIFNKQPTFILVRALNASHGSVERAAEMLLTGPPGSPPPSRVQQNVDNINSADLRWLGDLVDSAYEDEGEDKPPVRRDPTPTPAYEGKGKGKAPVRKSTEPPPKTQPIDIDPKARERLSTQYPSIENLSRRTVYRPIAPALSRQPGAGAGISSILGTTSGSTLLPSLGAGAMNQRLGNIAEEEARNTGAANVAPTSAGEALDDHARKLQASTRPESSRDEEWADEVERRIKESANATGETRQGDGGERDVVVDMGEDEEMCADDWIVGFQSSEEEDEMNEDGEGEDVTSGDDTDMDVTPEDTTPEDTTPESITHERVTPQDVLSAEVTPGGIIETVTPDEVTDEDAEGEEDDEDDDGDVYMFEG